jgi:hypothetical protein
MGLERAWTMATKLIPGIVYTSHKNTYAKCKDYVPVLRSVPGK